MKPVRRQQQPLQEQSRFSNFQPVAAVQQPAAPQPSPRRQQAYYQPAPRQPIAPVYQQQKQPAYKQPTYQQPQQPTYQQPTYQQPQQPTGIAAYPRAQHQTYTPEVTLPTLLLQVLTTTVSVHSGG